MGRIYLRPLSKLWEQIYRLRRSLYYSGYFKSKALQIPVVSVGNLTFGGTGKTPFTLWLSEYFEKNYLSPMILMRGYKGKLENSHGMLKASDSFARDVEQYGDEALIYVNRLKKTTVVVGKKRVHNFEYYQKEAGSDILLLDDGHQHLGLRRDLNFILFDALMPITQYKTAPEGYMREGFSALKDADVIVIGRADLVDEEKLASLEQLFLEHINGKDIPIVTTKYGPSRLVNPRFELTKEVDELSGKNVVILTGIAAPDSFIKMVENLGANVVETFTYPDHHFFTKEECEQVEEFAKEKDAWVLSTEKDMVKLQNLITLEGFYYLEINVNFIKGEKEVIDIIDKVINKYA